MPKEASAELKQEKDFADKEIYLSGDPTPIVFTGEFRRIIFGVPIFTGYVGNQGIAEKAQRLAYEFRDSEQGEVGLLAEEFAKGKKSNDKEEGGKHGITSYYSENLAINEKWKEVIEALTNASGEIFTESGIEVTGMRMSQMWFSIYPQDSFVPEHIHSNFRYSAVYYARAEKDCGDLVFRDPAWIAKCQGEGMNQKLNDTLGSSLYRIKPQQDLLVIFPSWLPHHTYQNKSGEDRIIVSFNFAFGDERFKM